MNIVVRSPNWIGDCIMALPALRAIKKNTPDSSVFLVAKDYLKDIFTNIPEIEKVIAIPNDSRSKDLFKTAGILKEYNFDSGILLTNSFKSALLFRLAGIKNLTGYNKDLRGFMLSNSVKYPSDNNHHYRFYLNLADHFQGKPSGETDSFEPDIRLVISEEEKNRAALKLKEHKIDHKGILIGISPSAAYGSAKQWLPERFKALIKGVRQEKPGAQILLLGSQKEREKISAITGKDEPGIFNLAGKLSLRESIVAMSFCRVFISNDSGLMHIASSLSLPLIALFGPTRPDKTAPLNRESILFHFPPDCSPCLHRDCPFPDHPCMSAITSDSVLEQTLTLLNKYGAHS